MPTTKKTFDSVEMKNRIQSALQTEYESRRGEFPSFVDFIKFVSANSEYARSMQRQFGGSRHL